MKQPLRVASLNIQMIAGTREMDATAILDYVAPLAAWLDEQNEGRGCG